METCSVLRVQAKSIVKAVDLCLGEVGCPSLWGGMQDARKTLLYNYNLLFVIGFLLLFFFIMPAGFRW